MKRLALVGLLISLAAPALAESTHWDLIYVDHLSYRSYGQDEESLVSQDSWALLVNTGSAPITVEELADFQLTSVASAPGFRFGSWIMAAYLPAEFGISAFAPKEALGSITPYNQVLLPLLRPTETVHPVPAYGYVLPLVLTRPVTADRTPVQFDFRLRVAGRAVTGRVVLDQPYGSALKTYLSATRVRSEKADHVPAIATAAEAPLPAMLHMANPAPRPHTWGAIKALYR